MSDVDIHEKHLQEKGNERPHREQLPCYGVPDCYRKRAQDLSAYLIQLSPEELDWGEDGCVTICNSRIQSSNIFDYIAFLVNPLSKNPPPHIETLLNFLFEKNCPQTLIHNVLAKKFMDDCVMKTAERGKKEKRDNRQAMTS